MQDVKQSTGQVPPSPGVTPPTTTPTPPQIIKNSPESPGEKPKKEGGILSFFATLIIAFILVQIINIFLFQSYKVFGSSMYPTLHDNDRLIISKISKTISKIKGKKYQPARGDIIVFTSPREPEIQLIKRVIGLPGDRVVVNDGKITVYNAENPKGFNPDSLQPYGKTLPVTSGRTDITVPSGHVFVSGDNREGSNSLDSRNELGTVPEEDIIGTLKIRLWPVSQTEFFKTGD